MCHCLRNFKHFLILLCSPIIHNFRLAALLGENSFTLCFVCLFVCVLQHIELCSNYITAKSTNVFVYFPPGNVCLLARSKGDSFWNTWSGQSEAPDTLGTTGLWSTIYIFKKVLHNLSYNSVSSKLYYEWSHKSMASKASIKRVAVYFFLSFFFACIYIKDVGSTYLQPA